METEQLGEYLMLVKQIFAAGGMSEIPYFLARQQQNALQGLRNEDSPK